ncbi:MAG TPA: GntR family transcriptional regulator [Edaphobacter sp.]|nr:GntR family transcriptional regulator [Edaphobacter sp.]
MEREPVLRIDPNSSIAVYRQVVDGLRSLLVEGSLQPGDTLPTVRDLGLELSVHFNTVAEAYRVLAEEGWLDLRRRRGAVVKQRSIPNERPETEAQFSQHLRRLVAQVRAEGLSISTIIQEMERLSRELTA